LIALPSPLGARSVRWCGGEGRSRTGGAGGGLCLVNSAQDRTCVVNLARASGLSSVSTQTRTLSWGLAAPLIALPTPLEFGPWVVAGECGWRALVAEAARAFSAWIRSGVGGRFGCSSCLCGGGCRRMLGGVSGAALGPVPRRAQRVLHFRSLPFSGASAWRSVGHCSLLPLFVACMYLRDRGLVSSVCIWRNEWCALLSSLKFGSRVRARGCGWWARVHVEAGQERSPRHVGDFGAVRCRV
jgi:hypothetical protein